MDPQVVRGTKEECRASWPSGKNLCGIFIPSKCPQLLGILLDKWDNLCLCAFQESQVWDTQSTSLPPTSLPQATRCGLDHHCFAWCLGNISLKGAEVGWREGWTEEQWYCLSPGGSCSVSSAPDRLKDRTGLLLRHSAQEGEFLLCRKWHSAGRKESPEGWR